MHTATPINTMPASPPATCRTETNILPFPPTVRDARDVAKVVETMPAALLLGAAQHSLDLAATHAADRTMTTANANAIWTALLCCARLLDAHGYPVIATLAGAEDVA